MKKVFLLASLSLLFYSCLIDQGEVLQNGKEVEIKFSTSAVLTRSPEIDESEKKIHTIDILVFQGNGTVAGAKNATFLYSRYAWKKNGSEDRYNAILKIGEKLDIYFVVNAKTLINNAGLTEGMTWENVRKKLELVNPDQIDLASGLPMCGFLLNQSVADTPMNNFSTVRLLRSIASVEAEVLSTDFALAKGHIVYAADKGYLTFSPSNTLDENGNTTIVEVPADMVTTTTWSKNPSGTNELKGLFYIYENDADGANGKRYTKLILEGRWSKSPNAGNTFYPLAIRKQSTDEKLQVRRNRKYMLIIRNVNGDGYPTLDEAKEAEDLNMDYKVIDWDRWMDNDIIVYGTNYISLSNDINENLSKRAVVYRPAGSTDLILFDTNIPVADFTMSMEDNTGAACGTYPDPDNKAVYRNDRFEVEINPNGHFKFTSLKAYESNVPDNPTKLIVTAGRLKFEISITQEDKSSEDWNDGGEVIPGNF